MLITHCISNLRLYDSPPSASSSSSSSSSEKEAAATTVDWREDHRDHLPKRRRMVRTIHKKMKDNLPKFTKGSAASTMDTSKLSRMAKQLEYRLYVKATSLEEYEDCRTIAERLRGVVRDMYREAGLTIPQHNRQRASAKPPSVVVVVHPNLIEMEDDDEDKNQYHQSSTSAGVTLTLGKQNESSRIVAE